MRSISKADVLRAFDEWLKPGTKRRMLIVEVIGNGETESGKGRPVIEQEQVGQYAIDQVANFRASCKKQTWGKINSKLF